VQAVVDQAQEIVRMRAEQAFAISLPVFLRCLHRILDSATLRNKRAGRRGYLDFVWGGQASYQRVPAALLRGSHGKERVVWKGFLVHVPT
jgi:hypothetical protein